MALYKAIEAVKIRDYDISKGDKYLVERIHIEGVRSYFAVYKAEPDVEKITDKTIVIPMKLTAEAIISNEELTGLLQKEIFIES